MQTDVQLYPKVAPPIAFKKLVIVASRDFGADTRLAIEAFIGGRLVPVVGDDEYSVWKGWCHNAVSEEILRYLAHQEQVHEWFSWRVM